MKRFLLLILLIPVLTLSSCGEPPTIRTDFSALFSANHTETDYAGTVAKDGDHLTITMTEPYTVKGMVFEYADTQLSIRKLGHSAEAKADYLPMESIPTALRNALLYLPQARCSGSENGCDHYTVDTPYGEAALTASDGYLTEITEPHSGITFHFESDNP